MIQINYKSYPAHRLVWVYQNGPIPNGALVDHINGDTLDNRIENLRLANDFVNAQNRKRPICNTSGHIGIYKYKGRWRAQINYKGCRHYLGSFQTIDQALHARQTAQQVYGFQGRV